MHSQVPEPIRFIEYYFKMNLIKLFTIEMQASVCRGVVWCGYMRLCNIFFLLKKIGNKGMCTTPLDLDQESLFAQTQTFIIEKIKISTQSLKWLDRT